MSNLNLGNVSFDMLRGRLGGRYNIKLAYATEATQSIQDGETVVRIYHHDTMIAELTKDSVRVSNRGYDSSTTRNRIHSILRGNGAPIGVTQKNFDQYFFIDGETDAKGKPMLRSFYGWLTWYRNTDSITLTDHLEDLHVIR